MYSWYDSFTDEMEKISNKKYMKVLVGKRSAPAPSRPMVRLDDPKFDHLWASPEEKAMSLGAVRRNTEKKRRAKKAFPKRLGPGYSTPE